jgi:hypothetical protein
MRSNLNLAWPKPITEITRIVGDLVNLEGCALCGGPYRTFAGELAQL